ncbi:hypothetical protein MHU86_20686 [Fragilaria crotonensis]|nr:hypothetical protein MHU86_20686 [Fragilaria crotonensis]
MDSKIPSPRIASKKLPEGFKCVSNAKEAHGQQIYSVAWSQDLYQYDDCNTLQCFATCGGNVASVYEVHEGPGKTTSIVLRQGYVDPMESETFYACVFGGRSLGRPFGYGPLKTSSDTPDSVMVPLRGPNCSPRKRARAPTEGGCNPKGIPEDTDDMFQMLVNTDFFDGPQLLCVAGTGAIIKVIDTCRRMLFTTLSGHGDDIYDLRFSPTDEWILLSASKDESLRMWNVKTSTCVAIFAGHEGHRDCVLSVAWHSHGHQFASGGMDTTVKLWAVGEGTDVHDAIARSKSVKPKRWDERVNPKEVPPYLRADSYLLDGQGPHQLRRCCSICG